MTLLDTMNDNMITSLIELTSTASNIRESTAVAVVYYVSWLIWRTVGFVVIGASQVVVTLVGILFQRDAWTPVFQRKIEERTMVGEISRLFNTDLVVMERIRVFDWWKILLFFLLLTFILVPLFSCILSYFTFLATVFRCIISPFKWWFICLKGNVRIPSPSLKVSITHESKHDGSEQVKMELPKCQLRIYESTNFTYKPIACAVRFDDYMVLPAHVLGTGSYFIHNRISSKFEPIDNAYERISLDKDLIAVSIPPVLWTTLGVKKSRSDAAIDNDIVRVVGVDLLGTTGKVRFVDGGKISYHGTTDLGYSGAAYINTLVDRIVGLHVHGGKENGGYESLYIEILLKYHEQNRLKDKGYIPEAKQRSGGDSESFLLKQFITDKEKVSIRRMPGDKSIVRDLTGHYHLVRTENVDRSLEMYNREMASRSRGSLDWVDSVSFEDLFDEDFPESKSIPTENSKKVPPPIPSPGEGTSTELPITQASAGIVQRADLPTSEVKRKLLMQLSRLSNRNLKSILASMRPRDM